MSLTRQIVMLLDAAGGPLPVRTLVEQIAAMGGDANKDAVRTRMEQMGRAGQARKDGEGWALVDALPLTNLRAKWARDAQPAQPISQSPAVVPPPPTLRDRIVSALRDAPGSTAQQLAARLGTLARNEPASTLHVLCKQQRVRHEGEWPGRRYFACDGKPVALPRTKRERPAKPSRAEPAPADLDPALLLEQADRWLESHAGWCTPAAVAAGMSIDKTAAADTLWRLVTTGRAVWRYMSALQRTRQYAHISSADAQRERSTVVPDVQSDAATTDREPDTHGTATAVEAPSECVPSVTQVALATAAQSASAALQDAAQAINQLISTDDLDSAIGANPATLSGYARCIALDLEDAIGRACDQQAPHSAIKALSVALGSTWRAISQISPGA